jgi:hypothetical protein
MLESAFKRAQASLQKDIMFIVTVFNEVAELYHMYYQNEVHFKYINQEYEGLGSVQEVIRFSLIIHSAAEASCH